MAKHHLKTLVQVLQEQKEDGFTADFEYRNYTLKVVGKSKPYKTSEVDIINQFRFEGETNPADSSILYTLETSDGIKGTIIDGYGASANPDLHEFLKRVEEN